MFLRNSKFRNIFGYLMLLMLPLPLLLVACGEATSTPAATLSPTATATTIKAEPAATSTPGRDFSEVDNLINRLMQMYDTPGVALGLIQDGKVIYTKGYGYRNTLTKAPVTENTLFAIGSVTKSFTALDVAQLVDQGKLDLDTPIVKYLPDFKLSDAEATQKLTLRHLLSHTSGLPRSDDWYSNKNQTRQQVVEGMAKIPLNAPVGKLWQYNNQNYVLAGYLVEKITGQSWEDYTRQHIFEPLGLKTANFDIDQTQRSPDFAAPHLLDVLKGMQPVPFFGDMTLVGPAGSINANILDMEQYARFQLGDGTFDGKPVVSDKLMNEMHRQQIAIDQGPASLVNNLGYGFGWLTEEYRGNKLVAHNGSIDGFMSYVTLVPSAKAGVVLLTNTSRSDPLLEAARLRLVEWLMGQPAEQDLAAFMNKQLDFDPATYHANLEAARTYKADPATYVPWLGDYNSVVGKVTVRTQDGKLYLHVEQPAKTDIELVPFKEGSFLASRSVLPPGTVLKFSADAQGTVTIYQNKDKLAERLGPGVKAAEYTDPQGRFSVTLPQGLVPVESNGVVAMKATNPDGLFVLAAQEAGNDDLKVSALKLINTKYDPSFNQEPADTRPVPVNGQTWTQFLYKLPSDQLLAVVATKQKETVYFVVLQAKLVDVQTLTPKFNDLLLNLKIKQ